MKSLRRWALHVKRLDARRSARQKVTDWRLRQGARLADTAHRDATLAWLLHATNRGLNVHAVAHGKRIAAKLGVQHYKTIGKLGADARWKKHRERKALLVLEDAHV